MMAAPDAVQWMFWFMAVCTTVVIVVILMVMMPGQRQRWIFRRQPFWLWRWLNGELSVSATFWQGGPLMVLAFWWLCRMGYGPHGILMSLLPGLWALGLAVALFNAGRKSRAEGGSCIRLAGMVAALLWMAAYSVREVAVTALTFLAGF